MLPERGDEVRSVDSHFPDQTGPTQRRLYFMRVKIRLNLLELYRAIKLRCVSGLVRVRGLRFKAQGEGAVRV